jgi:glycosyltransferase involved in cell wall biosynthesis
MSAHDSIFAMNDQPRILVVTSMPPLPPNHGGRQRSNHLIRALQQVGHVDLFLNDRPGTMEPRQSQLLRDEFGLVDCLVGRWGLARPYSTVHRVAPKLAFRLADWLEDRRRLYRLDPPVAEALRRRISAEKYDLIVCRYLLAACRTGALDFSPVWMDVDDVDSEAYRTRVHAPGTPWWESALMRRHERTVDAIVKANLPRCEGLWLVSDEDRALVTHPNVDILPNIPYAPSPIEPCPPRDSSRIVAVIGSMHPPNVHGVEHFVKAVWPAVRSAVNDAELHIGGGMPAELRGQWERTPGVKTLGFVDKVREVYDHCAFAAAPIFWGAGTKIKVVESLAHGRTCLVTEHSLHGYASTLRHGESLWLGRNDAELAEGCIRLLRDPDMRNRLARRGAEVVAERYSFSAFAQAVRRSVVSVLERRPGGVAPRSGAGATAA